ncbi:MAG TPA: hypothetical protein VF744_07530 [Beijerinckiaceae bacterium]|jgi:hypothetical protein
MRCSLLKLSRILRERQKPDKALSEPDAPQRNRERCGTRAGADHGVPARRPEREAGWIVSVDNFS